jgi:Na+/H+ antiporter NhaD/arsenite permease-like protein
VTGLEPPLAWTLSEFIAANTASAVLVPSNPTNILISGAFYLNFLTGFTKYTVLPSVIPAILLYPILLFMFKTAYPRSIPAKIIPPDVNPKSALIDPSGAIFHSVLMLVTLAVLVGTSFVPNEAVSVWMVTLPAGLISVARDVVVDFVRHNPGKQRKSPEPSPEIPPSGKATLEGADTPPPQETEKYPPRSLSREPRTVSSSLRRLEHRFPITSTTLSRLPIPILPFAMGMFILVRALLQRGWIDVFANGFAKACTSPAKATFFFGFMTVILCPFCGTNIGTTILMVEILRTPHFATKDPLIIKAAIYAVALGSNLGAFSVTFTGSLAGLLWRGILKQKGIVVTSTQFAMFNLIPVVFTTTLACAIILGEVYWF